MPLTEQLSGIPQSWKELKKQDSFYLRQNEMDAENYGSTRFSLPDPLQENKWLALCKPTWLPRRDPEHTYKFRTRPLPETGSTGDGVEDRLHQTRGASAISFEDGKKIPAAVQSSLRRLHQNLAHPSRED
eukprot:s12921_g1.t1